MKIAILGWGSLIWNPSTLKILDDVWYKNGPTLPIEFNRISNDGRLTLVIDTTLNTNVKTLYAFSKYQNLDEAILDLAVREGCNKTKIGYLIKESNKFSDNISAMKFKEVRILLTEWISNFEDVDTVIWTQLSANYKEKLGKDIFQPSDALTYLKNLPLDTQIKAEEYIRKAPLCVNTPIRNLVQNELNWNLII